MIDIHTHCLPGIDDGPATAEEALMMLRLFVAEGVRHVVATPHVYPGRFDNDRRSIAAALDALRVLAAPLGLPLTLGCAGEVRLSEHLPDLLARDDVFPEALRALRRAAPRVTGLFRRKSSIPVKGSTVVNAS